MSKQNSIIAWFTMNPVAANLLMAIILIAGSLSAYQIKKEFLPDLALNQVEISIDYPSASPTQVEIAISQKVESAVTGINGIKKMQTLAIEGNSTTAVEIEQGVDVRKVQDRIQNSIDAIDSFPENSKRAKISAVEFRESVLWLIISGDLDEKGLKYFASQIKEEMLALPKIKQIFIEGSRDYEISIEVDMEKLLQYSLTINEISEAIRNSSFDLPAGAIKSHQGEILLRSEGQAQTASDFASITLRSLPNGEELRVGDVAQVKDGFEESDWFLKYQGKKAAGLQVFRVADQSTLEVADAVESYINTKQETLPLGIDLDIIGNTATPLRDRISMMLKNLLLGSILVFVILTLFLRLRIAFWVMVGLPISFLGTLWLMPLNYFDLSINMISLFGFILVLGIVVDDAIVIGESIYSHQKKYGYGVQQVISGTQQVAMPATFGVVTTIAAFIPILSIPGVSGKLWAGVAWVVILSLFFSLIESKLILPAHLAKIPLHCSSKKGLIEQVQHRVSLGLDWIIKKIYRPSLNRALNSRYNTLALFIGLMLITTGLFQGGLIRMVFFPDIEGDAIQVELRMRPGTPFKTTENTAHLIEQSAKSLNAVVKKKTGNTHDVIAHLIAFSVEETVVSFYAELAPSEQRSMSASELIELWRTLTNKSQAILSLTFKGLEAVEQEALNFQLEGHNLDQLKRGAIEIKNTLSQIEGISDIQDTLNPGKQELNFSLMPTATALGFDLNGLSNSIRQGFYGEEVQSFQRGNELIKVWVRLPKASRKSLKTLEMLPVMANQEQISNLKFSDVAKSNIRRNFDGIYRTDRMRSINIMADIDKAKMDSESIIHRIETEVIPLLLKRYPQLSYRKAGEQKNQDEATDALLRGAILAFFAIYALIAIPLRSYSQPLIIMSAIPFGVIGAIWGHWLLGLPVSVLSLCGIVALSGVVVNDSLIMIDFINKARAKGSNLETAIVEAGSARFRAILLTSLTTFIGLCPMLFETSLQAQFLIPMTVSLGFGILFATLITLYLIPCLYLTTQDVLRLFGDRESTRTPTFIADQRK